MAVQVELRDMVNGNAQRVALPEDVPMRELLPTLAEKLGVETGRAGGTWTYKLVHKAPGTPYEYADGDTLNSKGTNEGDMLGLSYDFVAG